MPGRWGSTCLWRRGCWAESAGSRRVPDGGAPGALLDHLLVLGGAALFHAWRDAGGVVAAHLGSGADLLAPAAGRVLQYAGVVERLGGGVEIRVFPDRAQLAMAATGQALTNANLDTANNLGDGDVDAIYTIPSANNLRTTNGTELLVPLGHTFEPGDEYTTRITS